MKNEKKSLKKFEIKKSALASIKGGTSTTVMVEVGRTENEYPDDGNGKPDTTVKPITVEY
ncbi:hypothetical protein BAX94_01860 [Elizabethkingia meningoseptica]|uniref:Uncharacterized protein n=1 Tax=Elizabethkingia meningoseptica TaxID=238 RepID=A0A1V3TWV4_ELIME|nr:MULTISPECIES: hypothetical protein [Elizabethkingia]AQX12498.1 hypothetical protein BBD35_09000 [Elizabethkingia meningoseptica]MBG0514041.1 hypothetical protein [Elizabethkingia meningoseptica]MDE5432956.1 hypothetical protein [Elizabethkingia meningoseptica]MDE5449359.1 hypothetical protein [Elizabethkingia meningoseptica]MDE5471613.1 hypothetical protein [Elizabethkingia meningoseptica]